MKKIVRLVSAVMAIVAAMASLMPAQSAPAADKTFVVNDTHDGVDSNLMDGNCQTAGGKCTLRAAVQQANALYALSPGSMFTITLPATGTPPFQTPLVYSLTIPGPGEDAAATGDLDIKSNLLIKSTNFLAPATIKAVGLNDRVFHIIQPLSGPVDVSFFHVSIVNGVAVDFGGGIFNTSSGNVTLQTVTLMNNTVNAGGTGGGGAILNGAGTMTLNNVLIQANRVISGDGGGIVNRGTMILNSSTVKLNLVSQIIGDGTAERVGGGIYNDSNLLVVNDSSILSNTIVVVSGLGISDAQGGGIYSNHGVVTIANSVLGGNVASQTGGSLIQTATGGALAAKFTDLHISGSTIRDNGPEHEAGGVFVNSGPTVIDRSVIANNSATVGGGIQNSQGKITVTTSTFSANRSDSAVNFVDRGGGAIANGGGDANPSGSVFVSGSTFMLNTADRAGGGIFNLGVLTVTNSTFHSNQTMGFGGGIYNEGTAHLANVTLSANVADSDHDNQGDGGGIYNHSAASFYLHHTLLANNTDFPGSGNSFPDCAGDFSSQGHNLVLSPAGCNRFPSNLDIVNQNPNLGPLQDNGGATLTMALPAGSVAVNGGDPLGCKDANGSALSVDQRGVMRLGPCDIGAFERVLFAWLPLIRR